MTESENNRPVHLSGIQEEENITAVDLKKAIVNLERFVTKDIAEITTLDDVSFEMIFVGIGLRAVVVATGQLKEDTYIWYHPTRGEIDVVRRWHSIKRPLADGRIIYADTNNGAIRMQKIQQLDEAQLLDFDLRIPFIERISSGTLDHNLQIAHAVDFRRESKGSYYPAVSHDNPEVLQGYLHIAQEGVKDLLSITQPPITLPSHLS